MPPATPTGSLLASAPLDLSAVPPLPADTASAPAETLDPAVTLANAKADEIIEKYRATEALDPAATKRGCLVLFGAVFVLGATILLAIYYFGYVRK